MAKRPASLLIPAKFFNVPDLRSFFQDIIDILIDLGRSKGLLAVSASRTLQGADIGRALFVDATSTLTIPQKLNLNGDSIPIYTDTGVILTLAPGSGVTLKWFQGGTVSTGNRSVAANSVVTLLQQTSTSYIVSGNGIS